MINLYAEAGLVHTSGGVLSFPIETTLTRFQTKAKLKRVVPIGNDSTPPPVWTSPALE